MLKYLLDTNICIYMLKNQPQSVIEKFKTLRKGEVAISSVTWGELCCGLDTKDTCGRLETLGEHLLVAPYDKSAAFQYGVLSRQFPNRKASFDRMIAAHALALGITLVTNNIADFSLYAAAGLAVENWVC
jgi:tRNA(fMet)-specific endonuclease VapC